MIRFPSQVSGELRFKIAETESELEQAFALLHNAYVGEGLMDPHPSGLRVTKYHCLPSTTTLVAMQGERVVGTVSLVRQNTFGLPLESIFDLSHLPTGSRVAEVSSLAIADGMRNQRGRILFPLLKFMYQYSGEYFGITHLLIAVNPKWYPFYEAVLLFKKLSPKTVERYDFVNGAPAVGGILDLTQASAAFQEAYGWKAEHRNLHKFFTEAACTNMEFPLRKRGVIFDPVLTPALVKTFFIEKTRVLESLNDPERVFLRQQYENTPIHGLIPKPTVVPIFSRTEKRFDTKLSGRIKLPSGGTLPVLVQNVSLFGVGGFVHGQIQPGVYELYVDSEDLKPCVLTGEIHWLTPKRVFGFSLRSSRHGPPPEWRAFIETLEIRLKNEQTVTEERGKVAM